MCSKKYIIICILQIEIHLIKKYPDRCDKSIYLNLFLCYINKTMNLEIVFKSTRKNQ